MLETLSPWVLREITKKNSKAVFKFLMKWAKRGSNKNTLRIIKEGIKKLGRTEQEEILRLIKKNCNTYLQKVS
jgi:3-methyladenine DNA glycosylase AlkC